MPFARVRVIRWRVGWRSPLIISPAPQRSASIISAGPVFPSVFPCVPRFAASATTCFSRQAEDDIVSHRHIRESSSRKAASLALAQS